MNITIHRASSRGHANHGWLDTYHTFSFANYFNPERMQFGALRVLNDDKVLPEEGFGTHPHKNMEVVSIPLKGELRHGDSLNNSHTITRGEIQVMSAGTGIQHSEFNGSSTEPLEFLQIWIIPDRVNAPPRYRDYNIAPLLKHNEISTFLAPETDISIMQQAWFSWAELNRGVEREYKFKCQNTGVYVFVIDGEIEDRRHGAAPPGRSRHHGYGLHHHGGPPEFDRSADGSGRLTIGKMFRLNEENHWDLPYFQLPATITNGLGSSKRKINKVLSGILFTASLVQEFRCWNPVPPYGPQDH